MPELPEVETIRLGLQKYIVGKTIDSVEVRLKKIVSGDAKDIIGAKVIDVKRFGKGLVIDLDNGYSIAAHIKLTGQFIYRGPEVSTLRQGDGRQAKVALDKIGGELPNKWTHVVFKLRTKNLEPRTRTAYLYYNDLRQFGWIKIIKSSKLKDQGFFKELGPEPAVTKSIGVQPLNLELFREIVGKSNISIKPLLMDQKKMSGVGNIYANDALFEARIDPRRSAKQITREEAKKLYNSILKVLKKGLEQGGATEFSFVNVLGQEGGYQEHFLVYGREKEPCRVCKTPIQKIKLGGRGTYFCPACQR